MFRKLLIVVVVLCLVLPITLLLSNPNTPPVTPVSLGEKLFNDRLLSLDSSISCASCHVPRFAFADTARFSKGINGHLTTRNTPSILNMAERPYFFYDGRAATLEEQALVPITHPHEMANTIEEVEKRLNSNKEYVRYFRQAFRSRPSAANIIAAIAAFERSLETSDTRFDNWGGKNDTVTLSASERRGHAVFLVKGKCFECHFSPDFTGDEFRNIGLFDGKLLSDSGRFVVTRNLSDLGKFKTPGLRNVAQTAPYMHNGMFTTLKEVVEYYNNPTAFVPHPINADTILQQPLNLTEHEKKDLVAFLHTLTDTRYLKRKRTEQGSF